MNIERFVFPSETSALSAGETETAFRSVDWIETVLKQRDDLLARHGKSFAVHVPSGNWNRDKKQSFEIDLATTNPFTSFELLRTRNVDVLRQLRLYSQAFTGYQLATLEMAYKRPWIRKPLPQNFDEFVAMLAILPDEGTSRFLELAPKLPPELGMSLPAKFGEMGWLANGQIINYDSYCYLQRIALLHESNLLQFLANRPKGRPPRILEIGGGFGGLAYHLSRILPTADYTIVDIPESLVFAAIYLSVVKPDASIDLMVADRIVPDQCSIRLCPNFLMDHLLKTVDSFDLVINTCSLNEMTADQVSYYAERVSRHIGQDGIFFEQNADADRYGVSSLMPLLKQHFRNFQVCPSALVGPRLDPGPARLWVNVD